MRGVRGVGVGESEIMRQIHVTGLRAYNSEGTDRFTVKIDFIHQYIHHHPMTLKADTKGSDRLCKYIGGSGPPLSTYATWYTFSCYDSDIVSHCTHPLLFIVE